MHMKAKLKTFITASRPWVARGMAVLLALAGASVSAAEIESLAWEGGAGAVVQIRVKGEVAYTTESLEGGQRLRESTMSATHRCRCTPTSTAVRCRPGR